MTDCLQEIEKLSSVRGCPKRMMNGPCGGQVCGRCEVNQKAVCVWIRAYEKLKAEGKLDLMEKLCL
jgi:methylenetetrahydrofolate reductase (NADPH)